MSEPVNPSTNKVKQSLFPLSLQPSSPTSFPLAYGDNIWDIIEQCSAISEFTGNTGQFDQHAINELLANRIKNALDKLRQGALFLGEAQLNTQPNTEVNGIYLALTEGTYTNFVDSGSTAISVDAGEIALIVRSGNAWAKQHILTMPYIDPTTKHWIVDGQDSGVVAEGQDGVIPHIDPTTGNWFIGKTNTGVHAQGVPGQDAVNPFKGWYDAVITGEAGSKVITSETGKLPANPVVGDYAYVKTLIITGEAPSQTETPVVKIYECSTAGTWTDSDRKFNPDHSQSFQTGQEVNETPIDNSHLADPAEGSLALAEDARDFKVEILGETEETVAELTLTQSHMCFGRHEGSYPNEVNYYYTSSDISGGYIGSSIIASIKNGNGKIRFSKASGWDMRVTFVKKSLPTSGGLTFAQLVDGGYLSSFHDGASSPYKNYPVGASTYEVTVPSDCLYIVFTKFFYGGSGNHSNESAGTVNRLPASVSSVTYSHTDGIVDELDERIDGLEVLEGQNKDAIDNLLDDLYGEEQPIEEEGQRTTIKGSIDNSNWYGSPTNTKLQAIIVPIAGYSKLTITPSTRPTYFCITKSKLPASTVSAATIRSSYMATCDGYNPQTGFRAVIYPNGSESTPNGKQVLTLNENCKYLYVQKMYSDGYSYEPSEIILEKTERSGGELDSVQVGNGLPLKFVFVEKGDTTKKLTCMTLPISLQKGIYFSVKDDYRITNGYLIDHLTGKVVNDDLNTFVGNEAESSVYRRKSRITSTPALDVVYEIQRVDGSAITDTSEIVDEFVLLEDVFKRKMPQGIDPSIYYAYKEKLQTSIGNVWTPISKVPHSGSDSIKRFRGGVTYTGINYSGPTQWGKHVGIEVSLRTYKTALSNPRSVMYTERIGSHVGAVAKSAYGYSHGSYGKEAGAFYGCVCTGLTSYMLGLNHVIPSDTWNNWWGRQIFDTIMSGAVQNEGVLPPIKDAQDNSYNYDSKDDCKTLVEMLQPMDFIWRDGHCAVISDIYVKENGKVKYVVISEQTTPTSVSQAYSPEFFFLRFKNDAIDGKAWKVLRKKAAWTIGEASIPRTGQDSEFCIQDQSQYNPEDLGKIDDDITTFAGEYATFVIGDYTSSVNNFKLYLNIHRGGNDGYTHLQIFNEEDDETTAEPVDEIAIGSYTNEAGLGENHDGKILPNDTEDDWIAYNLADYWYDEDSNLRNTVGKFKARVVRKESDAVVFASKGCTHFEMVKIEMDITNSVLTFTVKGGRPVVYRGESTEGILRSKFVDIDPSDYYNQAEDSYIAYGDTAITLDLSEYSYADYIRLFVKTDYGMANRRIAKPS